MKSEEIREKFLSYFERHAHRRMRSSSLIPINDPTLLFINAGMNQFKDIFTGKIKPETPRAATSQKCMRVSGKHNDLENVGRTARHHTFFEMLGNFSFGDYFKQDAIRFAWELVTEEFKLDPAKLWMTVYEDDDEAYDIWVRDIGVDESRVVRMGAKDNFWSMGETGPCGPCSEIHIDQGEGPKGQWKDEDIYGDSDRYLELWNLVFMQYERLEDGSQIPLPKPSVDTGGGLERFAGVMQGAYSNYESDLFQPIINRTADMCSKQYRENGEDDTSLQVIADHIRACTFLIGDGALPSNLGRGYVLRRIMRRAIRHGNRLGFDRAFMPELSELVIDLMGTAYPELIRNRDFILNVVREEEKGFRRTLTTGLEILHEEIDKLDSDSSDLIPGEVAFKLYDTFGFPVDLTELIAAEKGKGVDKPGFEKSMAEQKKRGRASWKGAASDEKGKLYVEIRGELDKPVEFIGYEKADGLAEIKAIVAGGRRLEEAPEGMDIELVLDRTPFYGESGGQVGDMGLITDSDLEQSDVHELVETLSRGQEMALAGEFAMVVLDSSRPQEGLVVNSGRIVKGGLKTGMKVHAYVDVDRKNMIRSNHSVTHLLQYGLRTVLGDHVKQSGSFVGPDRLRFDFSHFQAIDGVQLERVEQLVNREIIRNHPVITEVKSLEQAQEDGAIAFFGEKYEDTVRVVTIGSHSSELCGGNHVKRSGDIGLFKIISESSIASGIRRIEALTGEAAMAHVQRESAALRESALRLSVAPGEVPDGIRSLFEQQKADKKRIDQLLREKAALQSVGLMDKVEEINGIPVLCTELADVDPKAFREYGQETMDKLGRGVLLLALPLGAKMNLLLGVSPEFRKVLPAGKTIGAVASVAGGKGGGKPDMAQAGGGDSDKVNKAFDKLKEIIGGLTL